MGPLANPRRINAIEGFIADAQDKGAKVAAGGKRIGNQGNFFQPTVLTDVPENARIMNEEPFGPVAVMLRFKETDDVLARANKLPFGLASYAFTKNANTATKVADALDSGMVTINHFGIALPETPFGGVKDFGLRPRRRHRGPARSTCRPSSSATWADDRNAEGGNSSRVAAFASVLTLFRQRRQQPCPAHTAAVVPAAAMTLAAYAIAVAARAVLHLLGHAFGLQGLIGRRHRRGGRKLRIEGQSANHQTRRNGNVS